jgi:hypothetical protein
MSFIVAGFALLSALLATVFVDDIGSKRGQTTRHDLPLEG